MRCKVKKSALIVYVILPLLLTIDLNGQSFTEFSAPSGAGDQILQELLISGDTLLGAMYGDGDFTWDSYTYSYPENSTLIFKTTIQDKLPLHELILQSKTGRVRIHHLLDMHDGFIITGSYLNSLTVDGYLQIVNARASSGFFILRTDNKLQPQDIIHYEGGVLHLPESIHVIGEQLVLPVSLHGEVYVSDKEFSAIETESLLVLHHDLNDLASANVDLLHNMEHFHLGDYAVKEDSLFIVGEFKDSIVTATNKVYNNGFYPDPVLIKYRWEEGLVEAFTLGGSYPAYIDRVLVSGDTTILIGEFMGGLTPAPGETISVGENAGIYLFSYVNGKYIGAHLLSSDAFLFYAAAEIINGKLLLSFSFVNDLYYQNQVFTTEHRESSYAILEIHDEKSRGEIFEIPYTGNGSFKSLSYAGDDMVVFGTCQGLNFVEAVETDGFDIIHLRKLEKSATSSILGTESSVKVYPQPAHNYLQVEGLDVNSQYFYRLYSMEGQLVSSENLSDFIEVSGLSPSIYFLHIYDDKVGLIHSLRCIIGEW